MTISKADERSRSLITSLFLETDTSNGRLQAHGREVAFDHSVAEIFNNERQAVTLGGNWRLTKQQAWSLKSIWG